MKTRLIGFAAQAESEGTRASSQKKRAMFMAEERLPKNELTRWTVARLTRAEFKREKTPQRSNLPFWVIIRPSNINN
jgi:hypothetical protein